MARKSSVVVVGTLTFWMCRWCIGQVQLTELNRAQAIHGNLMAGICRSGRGTLSAFSKTLSKSIVPDALLSDPA